VYWVTHAILTDVETWWWLVPLAAPALAIPLALFAVPPVLAARTLPAGWPRVLGFAGAWVLSEMARGVLFTGFPWNLIGSVWAFAALPAQGAALVGVHGLSLATVLLACLPLLGRVRPLAGGALAVAAAAALGAWRLSEPPPPSPATPASSIRLVLVQGNVAQQVKWREDQRLAIFRRYLDMTAEAAARAAADAPGRTVVAVWPETASPFLLAQDPDARRLIAEALPPGGVLLAGTVRGEWGEDRVLREIFNSLVALDADGAVAALADKFHLVPFGEYMPLAGLIPIRMVVGGMDFSAGPGPTTLSCARTAALRSAHLLRGDLPRRGGALAAAGLAAEHHQRRLVRLLFRTLAALGGGTDARHRGRPASGPGGADRRLRRVRRPRAATRHLAPRYDRHPGRGLAKRLAAHAVRPLRPPHPHDAVRVVPFGKSRRFASRFAKGCA
jgi:apolipoprotein N-acyltransferase